MANEFNDDDLYADQPEDSDLIRTLRKQLREKDRALQAANKRLETLEKESRASTLAKLLEGAGVNAKVVNKVVNLLPSDIDATQEAVDGWLSEYADVFNIKREEEPQESGADNAESSKDETPKGGTSTDEGSPVAGLSDNQLALLAQLQRIQQGAETPPLGADRMRQELADIRALPKEQAFAKLKELGFMAS